MYRLAIVTTLWQRHALTKFVLDHYASLEISGVDKRLVAIGSLQSGDTLSRDIALERGFAYVDAANSPLTEKWNAGVASLRDDDIDALVIVGSDDLLTRAYLERACDMISDGRDYVSATGLYFFEAHKRQALYTSDPTIRIGAGRVVSREALERLDYKLWPLRLDRAVDNSQHLHFAKHGFDLSYLDTSRDSDAALVDIKTRANIWSFEQMKASVTSTSVDSDEIFQRFPMLEYLRL